jgi:heme/copper-type cytochrome/quinol oxidase subunit 4
MSQEDAQKRIKELNREIRKHEIAFVLFIILGIFQILLTVMGFISFGVLPIIVILGCGLACHGIFKFSESFEVEKYFIELIFGKNGK